MTGIDRTVVAWVAAAALSGGLAMPAMAQPASMQASYQDFRRTCAGEIAAWGAPNDNFYMRIIAGPDGELGDASEVRQNSADSMAALEPLKGLFPPGKVAAAVALNECMLRVGLRNAAGSAPAAPPLPTAPAQYAAPAPAPALSADGLSPEVAAAFRRATTDAQRQRIRANAARYAASRPVLIVRANAGSGCVRPEFVNYRLDADTDNWSVVYRLTNSCATEQLSEVQTAGVSGWQAVWNAGYFPATWDIHDDPKVGFVPYNRSGAVPGYRLTGGQVYDGNWNHDALAASNRIEVWIGSCPAYSPDRIRQIMFRPAAYLRDDPRVGCVPARNGKGF